jgi:hypothetical protein
MQAETRAFPPEAFDKSLQLKLDGALYLQNSGIR